MAMAVYIVIFKEAFLYTEKNIPCYETNFHTTKKHLYAIHSEKKKVFFFLARIYRFVLKTFLIGLNIF